MSNAIDKPRFAIFIATRRSITRCSFISSVMDAQLSNAIAALRISIFIAAFLSRAFISAASSTISTHRENAPPAAAIFMRCAAFFSIAFCSRVSSSTSIQSPHAMAKPRFFIFFTMFRRRFLVRKSSFHTFHAFAPSAMRMRRRIAARRSC